jgi:UDP-2,4-diacetamido-2,4,6-trideoxy-beta-L-altropyranose hydrolase
VNVLLQRADAGAAIGNGHLIRSFALAQMWQATGGRAVVVTAGSDPLPPAVDVGGVEVVRLAAPHPDPDDAASVAELVHAHPGAWVACDGYHFDAAYTRGIRDAGGRVLVIDDIAHAAVYDADAILNQNIFAERLLYRCRTSSQMLLGPKHALVRQEFHRWRAHGRDRTLPVEHVLVTMGAADPYDQSSVALRALSALGGLRRLSIRVVVGPANPRTERYAALARECGLEAEFLCNPSEMAPVLA